MPKISRRLSGTGAFRSRTPTNQQTAENFTNMAQDFSRQRALVPDRKAGVLVEATRGMTRGDYRTMNASGRPMALGVDGVGKGRVDVGGSPDDRGPRKF